jgi:hypothetical protein
MATKKSSPAAPSTPATKLVITHRRALVGKYGTKGYAKLKAALDALAKADRKRGITTKLVLLDADVPAGGTKVATPAQAGKFKRAIDARVRKQGAPDYVLLLGGPDVIPHVPLRNPWADEEDEEATVPSDLPYACDQAHSLDAAKFLGVTRVVGRLPDVPGAKDAGYLVGLIQRATNVAMHAGKRHFGLSAEVWKGATAANLQRAFGAPSTSLYTSPSLGPTWGKPFLGRPFHLINCHGNPEYWEFSGQPGSGVEDYPAAIGVATLKGRVSAGTVVAAECCYGAELYAPRGTEVPQGMALSYLEEGAIAFVGSSTIAYGGFKAADVCCADILCAEFLRLVLTGASTGRAFLEARQALIAEAGTLDNYQLKTLAQFMLLGDPACRPVAAKGTPATKAKAKGARTGKLPAGHAVHRRALAKSGAALRVVAKAATQPVATSVSSAALAKMQLPGLRGDARVMQFAVPHDAAAPAPSAPQATDARRAIKRSGLRLAKHTTPASRASILVVMQDGYASTGAPPTPRVDDTLAGLAGAGIEAMATVLPTTPVVRLAARATAAKSARAAKRTVGRIAHALEPAPIAQPKARVKDRVAVVARVVDGRVVSRRTVTTR